MPSSRRNLILYALALAVVRIAVAPAGPTTWDEANGALGLWDFDVLQHRPQPPGYPLWILLGQPLSWIFGNEHLALVALSALAAGFAAWPMWILARTCAPHVVAAAHTGSGKSPRLGSTTPSRFAWWATALYTLNPIAWSFGSRALSGSLALLLAPLLVLLLLRARSGARRPLLWGSVLLGLAMGARQDLGVFLLPLWFLAWKGHRGVLPPLLVALATAAWAAPLIISCGGLTEYQQSTDYMGRILREESLLLGGSWERAGATIHRVLAALTLALGPLGLWGLWRLRRVPGWSTLMWSVVPALLFCVLGYFHKKAYLFPALPALTVFAVGGCWVAGPTVRRILQVQIAVWAALYLVLPSAEAVYRSDSGHLLPHHAVGYPKRLLYPWLEASWATVRGRDHRRERITGLLTNVAKDQPDALVWVEPGSRFSMREAMWAAPLLDVLECPLEREQRPGAVTLGREGEWHPLGETSDIVATDTLPTRADGSPRPVLFVGVDPDAAAKALGGAWVVLQVTPDFQVLLRR